ncbi:hypothetical protein D3C86_1604640 [compost metagenome]
MQVPKAHSLVHKLFRSDDDVIKLPQCMKILVVHLLYKNGLRQVALVKNHKLSQRICTLLEGKHPVGQIAFNSAWICPGRNLPDSACGSNSGNGEQTHISDTNGIHIPK